MNSYCNLGLNLKNIMSQNKLTISQLAADANISEDTIKAIRSGKTRNPGILIIAALADAIPCSIDSLLNRSSINSFANAPNDYTLRFSRTLLDILCSVQDKTEDTNIKVINIIIPIICYENGASYNNFSIDTIQLPPDFHTPVDFAIKIITDSLEPNIMRGDIVTLERKTPKNGDVVLCTKDGMAYLRRYMETDGTSLLHHLKYDSYPSFDINIDKVYCLGVINGSLNI